jgi:hypothetical protein
MYMQITVTIVASFFQVHSRYANERLALWMQGSKRLRQIPLDNVTKDIGALTK